MKCGVDTNKFSQNITGNPPLQTVPVYEKGVHMVYGHYTVTNRWVQTLKWTKLLVLADLFIFIPYLITMTVYIYVEQHSAGLQNVSCVVWKKRPRIFYRRNRLQNERFFCLRILDHRICNVIYYSLKCQDEYFGQRPSQGPCGLHLLCSWTIMALAWGTTICRTDRDGCCYYVRANGCSFHTLLCWITTVDIVSERWLKPFSSCT